ncbi:ClbS/DfsB family four-helix bundle protein [Bacillus mesophilum]|uniref:ClbS/DfsB family four-helix bundle protein n=1 Tax=Bacillus mesophilum TaxID=1071718 RepID=A0A7V7UXD2_9BACI|nr:ClbS/DfsB family four-helix bundle protein [Bacillus mesophilum]KAB2335665.1 ClbS/DfsB family four-helix bundle protein [Bacillus mesophilum]
MARPQNKEDLIQASNDHFAELFQRIQSIPEPLRTNEFEFPGLNRSIRDLICHLHEWHLFLENWYTTGMNGEKPAMPAEGYTWRTTPDLNRSIQEKYSRTELSVGIDLVKESHERMMELIESHTNEELFTKKYYKWPGTSSLGAYFVSNTSSHYVWANKIIKKYENHLKRNKVSHKN